MKKTHITRWFHVDEQLPIDSEYKIVRCINRDWDLKGNDFYFMAYFNGDDRSWEFFDEYEDMQVTHWTGTTNIAFDIEYTMDKEVKNEI